MRNVDVIVFDNFLIFDDDLTIIQNINLFCKIDKNLIFNDELFS